MRRASIEIGSLSKGWQLAVLPLGPLLALLCYWLLPETYLSSNGQVVEFSHAARGALSIALWMAFWWFTEAVPIAVTAMLPIVTFPVFQVATVKATLLPYASSTIFLFLGGFIIAAGIHRWHLDRRIALVTIKIFGTKPHQLILGLMCATAFISAWVSNTATAAMMVPIALSILGIVRLQGDEKGMSAQERNFAVALLLGIAYAASIGGIVTLIGTPPNGIFAKFMEQTYDKQVDFVSWMMVALPISLTLIPITFLLLTKVLFKDQIPGIVGGKAWIEEELKKLGKMSSGEKIAAFVFALAALLWMTGPIFRSIEIDGAFPFKVINDANIAMFAALLLFVIPVDLKRATRALDWLHAKDMIAWDVLILFGGGLSLAAALQKTGAAQAIGAQASALAGLDTFTMTASLSGLVIFASEFTSNTTLAATMMPLVDAIAQSLNIPPEGLLLTATISASTAFMMPVGTPPNAIVFGTSHLHIKDMIKAGFILNIISIFVVSIFSLLFADFFIASLI